MSGGERGFALLNALVIVAALAAVAAGLMQRAAVARERQVTGQQVWQAQLYLDAAEPLAGQLLAEDAAGDGGTDHEGEDWARPRRLEIDRGTVVLRLRDLQGRFNVNRLANPADGAARQGFERLLAVLGLPTGLAASVAGHLSPRGPSDAAAYVARPVPVRPAGGPVTAIEEIRLAPGMSAEAFARLAPHVAALPAGSALNVNTATPEVLAALLPGATPAAIERLVALRAASPFASPADFRSRAAALLRGPEAGAGFAVASAWFEADLVAELGGVTQRRLLVIERDRRLGAAELRHRSGQP